MKGKILQVCAVGVSVDKLLKPLLNACKEAGFEVHVACADDGYIEPLRNEGFIVHNVHFERDINIKSNLKSIRELYKLIKLHEYDIVHVHTPIAAVLGRIAAKLARVKHIIYTAHGFYFHEGMSEKEYNFYYNIEKYFARYATDYLLLQSKEDYELSLNDNFNKHERIIHISNGVDIYNKFNKHLIPEENLIRLKRELNINKNDIVFTFIGRFVREKGIFDLVNAFKELNKLHRNTKLMLIGGLLDSERDQEVQSTIDDWKEEGKIIFTGFRTDIPELLMVSDVFVLPSYREGLPRSIIEAMSMEKPVIATNIRGCREEVIHGETGYLVSKGNVKDLFDKMLKLTINEKLRNSMGQLGRVIVEDEYDEQKVLDKQISLFKKLLS